jgi:hypothetical protein
MINTRGGPAPTTRYPTDPSEVWATSTGAFTTDTALAGSVLDVVVEELGGELAGGVLDAVELVPGELVVEVAALLEALQPASSTATARAQIPSSRRRFIGRFCPTRGSIMYRPDLALGNA